MAYGSGGGSPYTGSNQRNQDGLSNRYSSPYQKSGGGSYSPPSANYAQQQTQIMEDTMRTHYEVSAEGIVAAGLALYRRNVCQRIKF